MGAKSDRIHYNPETGETGPCEADPTNPRSTGCKFGLSESEHYSTVREAEDAFAKTQELFGGATLRKNDTVELSEEQEKFFSQSAVRDENGAIRKVFHGTGAEFDEFDSKRLGQGNDTWGNGFYFSTNESVSRGYANEVGGKVMEFYIDVKNPLIVDGHEHSHIDSKYRFSREQLAKILSKLPNLDAQPADADDDIYKPMGDYVDEEFWSRDEHTPAQMKAMFKKFVKEQTELNPSWSTVEGLFGKEHGQDFLHAVAEATGHDGVIVNFGEGQGSHVVAWFPEQIKLTSNTNPTSSKKFAE